jgi:serine/threonine protein kinase
MTLPNYQLYFLPVISSCPVKLSSIDKKILAECEGITKAEADAKADAKGKAGAKTKAEDNSYILMEIPFVKNISFYNILIDMYASKKHIIVGLIENYSYLLDAISILLKKQIVHFDIKNQNILYNQNTHLPVVIDFGISINMANFDYKYIEVYFYTYSPDYYIWPLEVHVISFLLHETDAPLTDKDGENICANYVKYNKGLVNFSEGFKREYLRACETYVKTYVGKDRKKTIEALIAFYPTWDNYALSILYLKTFAFMFPHGFHKNTLILFFSQMLLYNISPNPAKRYSLEDTREKFKEIFFLEEQVDNYMDLIETFEYDVDYTTKAIQADIHQLNETKERGRGQVKGP